MSFRVEREDFLRSLEEVRRRIGEREKQFRDLASYAVKVRDYTAEAIYNLACEILELEKLLTIYMVAQLSR
ncbi:MAG: hypothetical protein QXO67_00530 [Candidatus Bathyarchaeia archaeon]